MSIYFDLEARIFSTQRPLYVAHILQGLVDNHKEISLAPSTSQIKHAVQHGKVCFLGVLDCGLGPSLVARTIKKNRQLELAVLMQGSEHQQISLSFSLEGLKESEMNAKCRQQHSLSADALLLASKPSI